jgi:hypothetical protein
MEHPKIKVTHLPPAGREEQLERWGISPSARWTEANRWGHGPDDALAAGEGADGDERELEERGFLLEGGWHAVEPPKGSVRGGGTTSHRGVLHPGEYVNEDALRVLVERELGFTYEQVRSVYRQGPLSPDQRELRARIDARLLALSNAGGNVALLGAALGFPVKANGNCRAMENALARARKEES